MVFLDLYKIENIFNPSGPGGGKIKQYVNFPQTQVFEKEDYRNLRFTNSRRLVNKNWGINLIAEIPPQECTERVVSCDGGDGPLGHPKVYINLVSNLKDMCLLDYLSYLL